MTLPKTYTLVEVADALGMSDRWVRAQFKNGAAHMRAGHKIRFTEAQYEALRESMTRAPVQKSITTGRGRRSA